MTHLLRAQEGSGGGGTETLPDRRTSLPDRRLLFDRLGLAIAQAQRHDHGVALVVVDVNKSTGMRAALGFEADSELTGMVADHLQAFTRRSDTLACIGSDLFAIVMGQVRDLPQVLGLTSRLMRLFDGHWQVAGQSLRLAPAVGVATFPESASDPEGLIGQAIGAAQRAARSGAHHPQLADRGWQEEARRRLALEADLRRALDRDELCLHYQPQVNAETGCVSGFEAALRWWHSRLGLISPDELTAVAEQSGLIVRIGAWVIEEAGRRLAAWSDAGHQGVRVAVSLDAAQLADDGLLDLVSMVVDENRIQDGQLEIEITERAAIADGDLTAGVLDGLKSFGARLTLDEFGTGCSSLRVLADYPFDTLKIDHSFVARAFDSAKERALTEAIVCLAHKAGMTVVADGVETREQLTLLHELGADEIQGAFVSPALPAPECEPFLAGRCDLASGRVV